MSSPDRHRRVLVAEDDAQLRRLLEMRLGLDGYDMAGAADGQEALRMVDEFHPDLLLCDVMMPRISGLTVCRELRSRSRHATLPIILLTARSRDEDVDAVIRLGRIVFMAKPFNAPELRIAISQLLESAAPLKRRTA